MTVKHEIWNGSTLLDCGTMSLEDIPNMLRDQEIKAAELLDEGNADHVLYACKIYGRGDRVIAVQCYMEQMNDEKFCSVTGKVNGAVIYALHNRNS